MRKRFRMSFEAFVEFSRGTPGFPIDCNEATYLPNDDTDYTVFDEHYIYHPAWDARMLAATGPGVHVDISSTLSFCSIDRLCFHSDQSTTIARRGCC